MRSFPMEYVLTRGPLADERMSMQQPKSIPNYDESLTDRLLCTVVLGFTLDTEPAIDLAILLHAFAMY